MLAIYSGVAFTVSGVTPSVAANATVEVRREDTGALASIFSDEAGTTPITNPSAFADANGRFSFYAEGLERGYRIDVTKDAFSYSLRNQAVGTAAQVDEDVFARAVITTKGDLYVGGAAGAEARKAIGADARVLTADSAQSDGLDWKEPALPRSYLAGGTLSNNGADATNDIDVSAGEARDSTNAANIRWSALTKRLDAAWAAGTNAGMLDTGSIANDVYHLYAIRKDSDGTGDILASASASAPTMPAGYTYFRRIGAILREGAAIVPFTQRGDHFTRTTPVSARTGALNTTTETPTLQVPDGISVRAHIAVRYDNAAGGEVLYISEISQADSAPDTSVFFTVYSVTVDGRYSAGPIYIFTSTSGTIRLRSGGTMNVDVVVHGWVDRRGRDE